MIPAFTSRFGSDGPSSGLWSPACYPPSPPLTKSPATTDASLSHTAVHPFGPLWTFFPPVSLVPRSTVATYPSVSPLRVSPVDTVRRPLFATIYSPFTLALWFFFSVCVVINFGRRFLVPSPLLGQDFC